MTACRHTGQVSWALDSAVWEERSPCLERNDWPPSGAHLSPLIRGRGQATNSDQWAHHYKAEARWINLISCDQLKYSHFSSPSVTSIWQASSTAREILFINLPVWPWFLFSTSPFLSYRCSYLFLSPGISFLFFTHRASQFHICRKFNIPCHPPDGISWKRNKIIYDITISSRRNYTSNNLPKANKFVLQNKWLLFTSFVRKMSN